MDLRRQRIDNEWALLERLEKANPALLVALERRQNDFLFKLRESTAVLLVEGQVQLCSEHNVRLSFPRFFPTMPIEAYVARPVFHPNVHPDTGFVCLWGRFSLRDTVVEALCQLQGVLAYGLFSEAADHVMQPEALCWAETELASGRLPLVYTPLQKPEGWREECEFSVINRRRRLD